MASKNSSSSSILHLLLHEEGESATSLDEDDFGIAIAQPLDDGFSAPDDAQVSFGSSSRSSESAENNELPLSILAPNEKSDCKKGGKNGNGQVFIPLFESDSVVLTPENFSGDEIETSSSLSFATKNNKNNQTSNDSDSQKELLLLSTGSFSSSSKTKTTSVETISTPTVVTITTATAALHNSDPTLDSLCQPSILLSAVQPDSESPRGGDTGASIQFDAELPKSPLNALPCCLSNYNKRNSIAIVEDHHHQQNKSLTLNKSPPTLPPHPNLTSLAVLRTKNADRGMHLTPRQNYPTPVSGPKHISGHDLRLSELVDRVKGGSARELNHEMMSHDNFKRWSLAGANPELALLRVKLEDVQHELGDLRSKHESTLNDYQGLLRQLEFFQEAKAKLETSLQAASSEVFRLRCENNRLSQQKCLSDRQIADLQLQLQRIQKERDEIVAGRSNADDFACKLMEELDDLRLDRENLRNTCRALESDCAEFKQTLIMSREDNRVMRLQYENQLEVQRIQMNSMEMSQNDAHQRYQKLAQERDLLRANIDIWHQDLEDNISNNARLQNILQQREEELRTLQIDYKKLSVDFDRLMSERNDVLEENARLSDGTGRQELLDQVRKLQIQLKNLQQLQQQEKFASNATPSNGFTADPEASEDEMVLISNQAQQTQLDDMRRRLESLTQQYESSCQELEKAKQSREWAMTERSRILAERDSMRTMCDELRRDRDSAVTKLADAYKDTEELQRSKEMAERELKKVKERLELDFKTKIPNTCSSPSNSRDSAIDNDLAEWEIETLTVNLVGSQKSDNIGIELGGGRDDMVGGNSVPIYVKSIESGSDFDGILRIYDCISQVNNIDVANMERRSVIDILRNSNSGVMVIKRRRLVGMKLISVTLDSSNDKDFGILFEDGIYVTKIKASSVAAKSGSLAVGDRLVYVNDMNVQGKSAAAVHEVLQSLKGSSMVLAVMKNPPVLSPMTPSASLLSSNSYTNSNNNPSSSSSSRPNNRSSSSNTNGTLTGFPGPQQQYYANKTTFGAVFKDEAVQTNQDFVQQQPLLSQPKKESLLNKVHDRFFGKNEKKSTVRASASIPNDFDDNLLRSIAANSRRRAYPHTGSERAANRYKAPSISSGGVFNPNQSNNNSNNNNNYVHQDEQEVLQGLDRILEASEKEEFPNKLLSKVINTDKNASGGTWPKSRPTPLISPMCTTKFDATAAPLPAFPFARNAKQRKNIPFFMQAPHNNDKSDNLSPENNYFADVSSSKNTSTHNMRLEGHASKLRCEEMRPVSYHPAVSGLHYLDQGIGGPSAECSSSFGAGGNNLNRTSTNSAFENYRDSSSAVLRCGSGANTIDRTSSVQAARRNKVVSQYEPVYANLEPMSAMTAGRRPNNILFGKRSTNLNAPPRYKPPPPVTGTSRFSPLPASVPPVVTSSLEQDIDSQSITSHSSGFSRCGFKNSYYNSHAVKNSVSKKPTALSPFKSYANDGLSSSHTKLSQGDVRSISLEKRSSEGLGINWKCSSSGTGGVFISSVSENSIAAKHGVQIGDQLLEVCGINMRTADYYYAKNVLSSIPQEEISLLVQYNPERYFRDPSLTPCATPNSMAGSSFLKSRDFSLQNQSNQWSCGVPTSNVGSNTRNQPRLIDIKKRVNDDWGFSIIGGNAVGIFVDGIQPESPTYSIYGLRNGDQILEFDGVDFRKLTLEQAIHDLRNRPCDSEVSILVQFNEQKYQKCKTFIAGGDSFYIRAHVDRKEENTDELSFKAGDVLRVDNTTFNGVLGSWRAWLVDQEGRERSCGIIPSKARLEEEYLNKIVTPEMSASDGNSEGGGSRRGTIRRSLKFIRRSSRTSHQRTSSKDSRDLQDLNAFSDELYQRVERIDDKKKRPVLILGALADKFIAKLLEDYPRIFAQCVPECVQPDSSRKLEHGLQTRVYVDYRKRDKLFEVTTVSAVNEIIGKGFHCILHVSTAAIDRLRSLHIYPIVIFVKFKNAKQIKEVTEDDINSRQAKEMFEQSERTEIECHHLFSAVVQGPHNNVKYFCQQIASAVDHEQKKTLWVTSNEPL